MKKIKVLQIISSLGDGGAETLVKDYCSYLDKNLFDVKIVVVQNVKNTANYRRINNINIEIIPIFRNYNLFSRLTRVFLGEIVIPARLKRIIAKEKPDIIHIHLPILRYFFSLDLTGISIFYTCHNLPKLMFKGKRAKEYATAKRLLNSFNFQIIALHKAMANEINELFGIKNTPIVYNGVDISKFRNIKKSKIEIRSENNIDENCFLIGHIGRFVEAKNHFFILDIFAKAFSQNTNTRLLLIGSGPLKQKVETEAKNLGLESYIYWFEHRKDINELLKAMDVFLFPSLYEGFPVTLIEAQASGLRCVVSNTVTSEAVLLKTTRVLSLDSTADEWAEALFDQDCVKSNTDSIDSFDMKNKIIDLEKLYLESIHYDIK